MCGTCVGCESVCWICEFVECVEYVMCVLGCVLYDVGVVCVSVRWICVLCACAVDVLYV